MRIGPGAVMLLSCLVIAGCGGYDVSGHEQRTLKGLDARYPEARWGVRCQGGGSSDSLPQCYLGFELRKPKPTMLHLLKIDLRKLTNYRTFWVVCGLYFGIMAFNTSMPLDVVTNIVI